MKRICLMPGEEGQAAFMACPRCKTQATVTQIKHCWLLECHSSLRVEGAAGLPRGPWSDRGKCTIRAGQVSLLMSVRDPGRRY